MCQYFTPYYTTFSLLKIISIFLNYIGIIYISVKIIRHVYKKYKVSKEKFLIWYQKKMNFDDQLVLSLIMVYQLFVLFLMFIRIYIKFDGWNRITPAVFIMLSVNSSVFLTFVTLLPAKMLSLDLMKSRLDTENKENFVRYIR